MVSCVVVAAVIIAAVIIAAVIVATVIIAAVIVAAVIVAAVIVSFAFVMAAAAARVVVCFVFRSTNTTRTETISVSKVSWDCILRDPDGVGVSGISGGNMADLYFVVAAVIIAMIVSVIIAVIVAMIASVIVTAMIIASLLTLLVGISDAGSHDDRAADSIGLVPTICEVVLGTVVVAGEKAGSLKGFECPRIIIRGERIAG